MSIPQANPKTQYGVHLLPYRRLIKYEQVNLLFKDQFILFQYNFYCNPRITTLENGIEIGDNSPRLNPVV